MRCSSATFWPLSCTLSVMALKAPASRQTASTETRIIRFSTAERTVHWAVALAFLYATLTGLALWSPRLFWLSAIFGGGTTVRAWHPWGGVLFALFFAVMCRAWRKQMLLDRDDRRWLRNAHRYAVQDRKSVV